MTNKFALAEQQELFAKDCKLIDLHYEYENYTGKEKWAIVTELSENELKSKYPDVIRRYTPFVLLSVAQGRVITDYQNAEAKERMRKLRYGHPFDINDGEFEEHHPELFVEDDTAEQLCLKEEKQCILSRKLVLVIRKKQEQKLHFLLMEVFLRQQSLILKPLRFVFVRQLSSQRV